MHYNILDKLMMVTAFMIFGVIFFLVGLSSLIRGDKSKKWEPTNGVVLSSNLKSESTRSEGVISHTYQTLIAYEYEWQGTTYKGRRIAFGYNPSSNQEWHESIYKKLQKNNKIKVRVNPKEPSQSVIATGPIGSINMVSWPALIFGYVVMSIFLLMARNGYPRFEPILTIVLQFLLMIMIAACIYGLSNANAPDLFDKIELIP